MSTQQQNKKQRPRKKVVKTAEKKIAPTVQRQKKKGKPRTRVMTTKMLTEQLNDSGYKPNEVIQVTANQQAVDTLRRNVPMSGGAITEFFSCLLSKIIALGVTRVKDFDYNAFYSGYRYMVESACAMIQGQAALEEAPRVVADWIAALTPKSVKFHGFASVSNGWEAFLTGGHDAVPIGAVNYNYQEVTILNANWNSPSGINTSLSSKDNYPYFLGVASGASQIPVIKQALQTVSIENYKSPLSKDVSAFSYSYPYFGLTADGTTAYWNNAENMVGITCPDLAKYVPYPAQGNIDFASRKYTPTCGGPGHFLSMMADLPPSFFNKDPPIIKQLDLLDVRLRLISWITGLVKKRFQMNGNIPAGPILAMTYQDFSVIVRQMVLSNSPAQFLSQFDGCNTYAANSNYFQPFFITASTTPSLYFSNMKIPVILAENLAMLREMAFKYNYKGVSATNFDRYLPVWGYYPSDPQLDVTVNLNGTLVPLFQPQGFGGEQVLALADGSYGGAGNPQYVNMNSTFYNLAVNKWNDLVTDLQDWSGKLSTNNKAFTGKVPYAMMVTRVISSLVPTLPLPDDYVSVYGKYFDLERILKSKVDNKSKITLPPGLPQYLHIDAHVSAIPLPEEIFGVLNNFITPHIRIDFNQQTYIDTPQYQAAVGELISIPADQTIGSATYFTTAEFFAENCITGIGRDNTTEIQAVFDVMLAKGEGGAIAELLAGILGQILPGGAPIFKTIASLVPI